MRKWSEFFGEVRKGVRSLYEAVRYSSRKILGYCVCGMKPVVMLNDMWVPVEDHGKKCFWCGRKK